MCPSDIFQLAAPNQNFGPETEVYASSLQYPCSIALLDQKLSDKVKIQIMKDDGAEWNDYQEGQLLIGRRIKCRLAYRGATRKIEIEVFHT